MHKYLNAIGFSDIRKKDLDIILQDVIEHPDKMTVAKNSAGNELAEFLQQVSPNIGIAVRGTYNEEDEFEMEYYVPYFTGDVLTTQEKVNVEKKIENESYAGVCDDSRVGLTLIFNINNVADVLTETKGNVKKGQFHGANLSALSTEGKVLLPIRQEKPVKTVIDEKKREKLLEEASNGNEEAIEHLSMQDMNLYSIITKRVQKEDIMTIVSNYFMPYGIESDLYGILGNILDVREVENLITEEHMYIIKVSCDGLVFEVCINKKSLTGIPAIGRRLKANIWLLGTL